MSHSSLDALIAGYKAFYNDYLLPKNDQYRASVRHGQKARVMMVSCSDSRVNSSIVTHSNLGEIFTVTNVANLVPPYKVGTDTHHSTSSAIEFALNNLDIEHIIVLGHSGCGGISALMESSAPATANDSSNYSFIQAWMSIAHKARDKVLAEYSHLTIEEQNARCEREALLVSLDNLQTFPWVASAMAKGKLKIHAWHFNIETGIIEYYQQEQKKFIPMITKKSE